MICPTIHIHTQPSILLFNEAEHLFLRTEKKREKKKKAGDEIKEKKRRY